MSTVVNITEAPPESWFILGMWCSMSSRLAYRTLRQSLKPHEDTHYSAPLIGKWGKGLWNFWAAAAAGVVLSGGIAMLPGVIAVSVVMIGARIAAHDAWNRTEPRPAGFYLGTVTSRQAVSAAAVLGLTGVHALVATMFIGNKLGASDLPAVRDVWSGQVTAATVGVVVLIACMIALLSVPIAVVAELVAGVARQDHAVMERKASVARNEERQVLANQLHNRVLTTVAALPRLRSQPSDHGEAVSFILVRLRGLQYERYSMTGTTKLIEALRPAEESTKVVGRKINFEAAGDLDFVVGPQENPILERCASSLTQNSIRAGARNIAVTVMGLGEVVELTVTDDAGGFNPDSALAGCGDLPRLKAELEFIGGELLFLGRPCSTVRCVVPLEP